MNTPEASPSIEESLGKALLALEPVLLEIRNESDAHRGHAAVMAQKAEKRRETHFFVRIASEKFCGLSPVEQHRLVYQLAQKEMAGGLHALRLETLLPEDLS